MRIIMAVNDENGNPTGRVEAINFVDRGNIIMELELVTDNAPQFLRSSDDKYLYIGRKAYRCAGYTTWAGSMIFDAAVIPRRTAELLAENLRRSGRWHCASAETDIFNAWEQGEKIYL